MYKTGGSSVYSREQKDHLGIKYQL